MPKNNSVYLSGFIVDEPHFEVLNDSTPYVRFKLVVLRDTGQLQRYALEASTDSHHSQRPEPRHRRDVLRVVAYGQHAQVDYFYLRSGAQVTVYGWAESRLYFDRKLHQRRQVIEINAQRIIPGRGCDFERGDKHRQRLEEEARDQGIVNFSPLGLDPIGLLPEDECDDLRDAVDNGYAN